MKKLSAPEPERSIDTVARRYRSVGALAPLAVVIAALSWGGLYEIGLRALPWQAPSGALTWLSLAAFAAALGLVVWQIHLATRYRPIVPLDPASLPSITVVVPAYNEGAQVVRTLVSLARSRYPIDRVQIIAVDDGSQDDTWAWMSRAARRLGGRIELMRLEDNRGKRHALAAGFARARGEIVTTVDSDSEVHPNTLASLAAPFLAHPRVGAVAGNIRVLDRQSGLIARILDAAFTYSFELIRAGQSVYGAVLCTPGAASAYRTDLIREVLVEWQDQRFMGKPANIGEDRALTNLILCRGFDVVFQSTAIVETTVPSTYGGLSRMLLRWARSNFRETITLCGFVFTSFRDDRLAGARVFAVSGVLDLVMGSLAFAAVLMSLVLAPIHTLGLLVLGASISAILPSVAYRILRGKGGAASTWLNAMASLFVLSWITPWALLTPHKNGWLTRALPRSSTTAARARLPRPAE